MIHLLILICACSYESFTQMEEYAWNDNAKQRTKKKSQYIHSSLNTLGIVIELLNFSLLSRGRLTVSFASKVYTLSLRLDVLWAQTLCILLTTMTVIALMHSNEAWLAPMCVTLFSRSKVFFLAHMCYTLMGDCRTRPNGRYVVALGQSNSPQYLLHCYRARKFSHTSTPRLLYFSCRSRLSNSF